VSPARKAGPGPDAIPLWIEFATPPAGSTAIEPENSEGPAYDPTPADAWLYLSPHDRFLVERLEAESAVFRELIDELSPQLPAVRPLIRDLFAAFWRSLVIENEGGAADPAVAHHGRLLERLRASESYTRLHPETAGKMAEAVLVVAAFARAFARSLDPEIVEFLDAEASYAEQHTRLEEERERLAELIESRAPKRSAEPSEDGRPAPEALTKSERQARLAALDEDLRKLRRKRASDFRLMQARAALARHLESDSVELRLEEVAGEMADFERSLAAWGDGEADPAELTIDERLELFRALSDDPRLRAATELLGRSRQRASAAHKSLLAAAPARISGVTLGDRLDRVLPSELALLDDPSSEREFMRRYAESELALHKVEEEGPKRRGPLIACVDESSSMEGEPDTVAKTIALALCGIARADRRDAALIRFAGPGHVELTALPKGAGGVVETAKALAAFMGGGTDFNGPLAAAYDLVDADPRFGEADILLLTDGEASVTDETLTRIRSAAEANRARLFIVAVGDGGNRELEALARATWRISELATERERLVDELVAAMHQTEATLVH
jgi:uncharacterized protein with von Willebrand factor type A (vWA) domain